MRCYYGRGHRFGRPNGAPLIAFPFFFNQGPITGNRIIDEQNKIALYRRAVHDLLADLTGLTCAINGVLATRNLPDDRFAAECETRVVPYWRHLFRWMDGHEQKRVIPTLPTIETLCKAEVEPFRVRGMTCWTAGEATEVLAKQLFNEVPERTFEDVKPRFVTKYRAWLKRDCEAAVELVNELRDRVEVEAAKATQQLTGKPKLQPAALSDLIPPFIEAVGRYLRTRRLNRFHAEIEHARYAGGTLPDVPAEVKTLLAAERVPGRREREDVPDDYAATSQARHEPQMDARDGLLRQVEPLKAAMQSAGRDCTLLLKLVFFVKDGGGPDNAYAIWPDLRAQLQQAAAHEGGSNVPAATAETATDTTGTVEPAGYDDVNHLPDAAIDTPEKLAEWIDALRTHSQMRAGAGLQRFSDEAMRRQVVGLAAKYRLGLPETAARSLDDILLWCASQPAKRDRVEGKVKNKATGDVEGGITVTEAARLLMGDLSDLTLAKARARVSNAASRNRFKTNGRKRTARRIDLHSFNTWRLEQRDRDLDESDAWAADESCALRGVHRAKG